MRWKSSLKQWYLVLPNVQLMIRYAEDIRLAHEAGCNAFRLSIEWARIEPRRGYIDLEAVAR